MAYDIFISYATPDKNIADAICVRMESEGVRCWIAPRDVRPGSVYSDEIITALEQCKGLVLVFSGSANSSQHVGREVERAVSKEKVILPFRVEDVQPSKSLEYFISGTHWLDALSPPMEEHIAELVAVTKRVVSAQQDEPTATGSASVPRRREAGSPGNTIPDESRAKIAIWKKALSGSNPRLRDDAARSLIQGGEAAAVIDCLSNKLKEVRMAAARALCELKVLAALPYLVSGLRNEGHRRQAEVIPDVESALCNFGTDAIEALTEEMRRGVAVEERHRFVAALICCLDARHLSDLLRNATGLCRLTLTETALRSGLPLDRGDIEPYLNSLGRYGSNGEYFDDHFPAEASEWLLRSSIRDESWTHDCVRSWLRLACVDGEFLRLVASVDQKILARSALRMNAVDADGLRGLAFEVESMTKPGDKQEVAADLREVADGKW